MADTTIAAPKVLLDIDGPLARLTLNDPKSMNALSESMVELVRQKLKEAEASARVMILSGAGGNFCSGANLAPGEGMDSGDVGFDAGLGLETHFNPLAQDLRNLSIPWISSVSGAAAGVGCALALSADLVIAAEGAYFLQAFRRIGLVPDGGSAYVLTRGAGRVRAMEMMLLGEKIPAATALQWGLVNRVVPAESLDETVDDIATKLATGPTRALALTRKSAWAATELDFTGSIGLERELQAIAGRTADFREGVSAFRERRPARFTGE